MSAVWWNTNAKTTYAPFEYTISNGTQNFSDTYYDTTWMFSGSQSFTKISTVIEDNMGTHSSQNMTNSYIVTFNGSVNSLFNYDSNVESKKLNIEISLKFPY